MRVFALGDTHLALGIPGKTMDVFGAQWENHHRTIEKHWTELVSDDDLVLVPGDVSWAMRLPEARPDLHFISRLPGRKVLLKGNHDYWWASASKVRQALPEGMLAVHGDAVLVENVVIAGTRMWDIPDLSFADLIDWQPGPSPRKPRTPEDVAQDRKIYEREWQRLEVSLRRLDEVAATAPEGPILRIVMTHYPPCAADLSPGPATELFAKHRIDHVVFGHLHSVRRDLNPLPFGKKDATEYHLTSCDYIDFRPRLIAENPTP